MPDEVDGIKQAPIEGVSFAYTFDQADVPSRHHTQYFEMMGDHAIYHDGWIASTKVIRPPWEVVGPVNPDPFNNCTWELYDLTNDWTQDEDVAAKYPEKVQEMKELFATEARKYECYRSMRRWRRASRRPGRTSLPAGPCSPTPRQ